MCTQCVEWNGARWHRYYGGYYERTAKGGGKRVSMRLHREIWRFAFGCVPDGHDVHHKDGDKGNNSLDNLELLSRPDHMRHHRAGMRVPNNDWVADDAGEKPCVDCGRAVIRLRGNEAVCQKCQYRRADMRRTKTKECINCGAGFQTIRGNYCSQRCVNLATKGGTTCVLPKG